MKVLRKILLISSLVFLALLLTAFGYYFAVTKGVKLQPQKLVLSEKNVVIYDENGEIASVSTGSVRQTVAIENVPKKTQLAFVDTEDKRFFTHNGFDFRRIVKAAMANLRSGSFKQGASTISQQLIKNTHLSQEKTLRRKLKEWKLTRELERKYSKEEILEKYLNIIYFGHNCFGLTSASEFYFGKTPDQLDLADSAILAGLVKSPNNYSPFKNAENCKRRKETVLKGMLKNGSIAEAEMQAALEKPLPEAPTVNTRDVGYAHFVFDELTALSEEYGFTVGGKIEIYTYLNEDLQNKLVALAADYTDTDITMSVISSDTHGFSACLSTVGEIKRLPASILKPLLVYAPALEENILSPATPVLDEKINYGGYTPENYDGRFHGYTSTRECVAKSLNIPAVRILETLGVKKGAAYLEKLGLSVDEADLSLALALGGMQNGFSLQRLVNAYSALQNNGEYIESGFIRTIKIDGNEAYTRKIAPRRVFSNDTAYLMTDMLQTAARSGTAKKLRNLPFEIAAKTGTMGTDNGNTDAYALSYTTRDVVGVWLGNADNSYIDCTGGGTPCNFLLQINEYLSDAYDKRGESIAPFAKPSSIVRVALDKTSYYDTHTLSLADDNSPMEYRIFELFKQSAIPTKKCDIFSNPSIISPVLRYETGKVIITFDDKSPRFYSYKIDRYDYATHTTVYLGEYTKEFVDEKVINGKNYLYTVTPIYNEKEGKAIVLPTVTTKEGEIANPKDWEIIQKNWWDY
ncbi:MAG: transglycosylase domain-containing protein [Clostridia bacterium]|nr:transglycosylase domain-containing protein [Clostridia bacterium]